ncbi:hypothetical protein EJD97_020079, partial [Solanum chilense]
LKISFSTFKSTFLKLLLLSPSKQALNSFESLKRQAQREAEEAKKKLTFMSKKLEDSEKQLLELSDFEEELKTELSNLQVEVIQLRVALEISETRYQEEYIHSTLQIRSVYELVEQSKSKSIQEEVEWEAKLEMKKRETEGSKANYSALALVEAARTTEKEAMVKLVHLTEEADNSIRKPTCVTDQLDWRKAAEEAATMLSTGNNGTYAQRTCTLDYTLGCIRCYLKAQMMTLPRRIMKPVEKD